MPLSLGEDGVDREVPVMEVETEVCRRSERRGCSVEEFLAAGISTSAVFVAADGRTVDIRGRRIFRPDEGVADSVLTEGAVVVVEIGWIFRLAGVDAICLACRGVFSFDGGNGSTAGESVDLYCREGCSEEGAGTLRIVERGGACPLVCTGGKDVRVIGDSALRDGCLCRLGLDGSVPVRSSAAPPAPASGCSESASVRAWSCVVAAVGEGSVGTEEEVILPRRLINLPFESLLCLRDVCSGSAKSRESSENSAKSSVKPYALVGRGRREDRLTEFDAD